MDKPIIWNELKSRRLKLTRGASFEELLKGKLVGIGKNPARINQRVYFIEYKNYIWAVPFVISEAHIFLKTLYPSRKHTKIYREEGKL